MDAMENTAIDIPTQFHDFIRNDALEELRSFITAENIHMQDENGNNALHFTAFYNKVKAGKMLLDFGAKINTTNGFGKTALHCAIDMQHLEITELLLNHDDINVNAQSNKGDTPLHIAFKHHWNNIRDIDLTPESQLLVAKRDKNILIIIEWLLGCDADQSIKNNKKKRVDRGLELNGSISPQDYDIYQERCTLYLHSLLLYQRLYHFQKEEKRLKKLREQKKQHSIPCCIQF